MEPRVITISKHTFYCRLRMTPELGTLPISNWRKILRLAMEPDPWEDDHKGNRAALQEIRMFLPDIVFDADQAAKKAAALYKSGRLPVKGKTEAERLIAKDHNASLKYNAQKATAEYKRLSKMLSVFREETQNYFL